MPMLILPGAKYFHKLCQDCVFAADTVLCSLAVVVMTEGLSVMFPVGIFGSEDF